jgi:hypothetical protein
MCVTTALDGLAVNVLLRYMNDTLPSSDIFFLSIIINDSLKQCLY